MRKQTKLGLKSASLLAAVLLLATGCSPQTTATEDPPAGEAAEVQEAGNFANIQEVAEAYSIGEMCGDEDMTIGHVVVVGIAWYNAVTALLEKQISECPNAELVTLDAQGDPDKATSHVNTLVAQGVDGIIAYGAWPQVAPAYRNAMQAGIPVVTYVADASARIGTDITDAAYADNAANGEIWVDFMARALEGEGTVGFMAAPEVGASGGIANHQAVKSAIGEHPGLEFVNPEESQIPWAENDPAKLRAVTGTFLGQYGQVDGIITDYGVITPQVVDAYQSSGYDLKAVAFASTSNGMNCAAVNNDIPMLATDGSQGVSFAALHRVVAEIQGVDSTMPMVLGPYVVADSLEGPEPKCDPSFSPDVDWDLGLSDDQLREIFPN